MIATALKSRTYKPHTDHQADDAKPFSPPAPTPGAPPPTHETIAVRAYEIWQRHGCPEGTAFHDWLAAEAELRSHR